MLLYLALVRPFRFTSTLLMTALPESYLLILAIIFSQYPQSPPLRSSTLSTLDIASIAVSLVTSVSFTAYTLYDAWSSLLEWKHARDNRLLNPYQVQASYTQTGRVKVREAALKLVEIAENRAKIGDEFTDVMVGGAGTLAEKIEKVEIDEDETPENGGHTSVDIKSKLKKDTSSKNKVKV